MVLLHPQSSLAGQALSLAPSDVLVYQYVLRTNKSYLVNPMPASAAHTLLLYSHCSTRHIFVCCRVPVCTHLRLS